MCQWCWSSMPSLLPIQWQPFFMAFSISHPPSPNPQLPTLNCQLSIVNCQLSIVNCQLSIVNCQLSTSLVSDDLQVECFGFLPKHPELEQGSRYLGLDFSEEAKNETLVKLLEENVQWEKLLML